MNDERERQIRRTFDAAQKVACDAAAYDSGDRSPMGGACTCADPNSPTVIAGLLAVAGEPPRRAAQIGPERAADAHAETLDAAPSPREDLIEAAEWLSVLSRAWAGSGLSEVRNLIDRLTAHARRIER